MYSNKVIVAPMVRVSTLPFRLLCLDYGADLVYTEETIDFKMLRSIKKENEVFGTTDFVDKSDGTIFFRTCKLEKEKLIFQIGTANAQRALKVALLVQDHVAGIDINMGCPKEFSIKGGMGAALLQQPEKIKDILITLTKNLSIPVTCKIRILPTCEETIALCKLIEGCGVAAIAIHGRRKDERPNHSNHNDIIRRAAEALTIPVIANGGSKEIESYEDFEKFRSETGASSIMIARAAMWNCSILRKKGTLHHDVVIKDYLKYCVQYDNPFTYSKYTVQNILRELQSTEKGKAFLETQTLQEICSLWDLKDYFNDFMKEHFSTIADSKVNSRSCAPQSIENIKIEEKEENGVKIIEMPLHFIRGNYSNANLPKMILNNHAFKNGIKLLQYNCEMVEKFFVSDVNVDGIKYRSSIKEKSRRYAEQAAALVYLHTKGLVEKYYGFIPSVGTRKHKNLVTYKAKIENKKRILDNNTNDDFREKKSSKLSENTLL
ncbi:UNVERIFIED_CONTAM: hypothetical protein RMT77_005974 [Armadillidium vulgare]